MSRNRKQWNEAREMQVEYGPNELSDDAPPPPRRVPLPENWPHRQLHRHVVEALKAIPAYFRSDTQIAGVKANDIHTFAAAIGAAIEDQVVMTLNSMRSAWDPEQQYGDYYFVRQPQTFPDVLLRKDPLSKTKDDIIMGIELKGWYLLAKEGEGSFRFTVSPSACTPQDLIVIVPWALRNVMSGDPVVFTPFVESALYAAEYRNYYWRHVKTGPNDRDIKLAQAEPYPSKSDEISDRASDDSGKNFGRIFRYGIMNDYLERIKRVELCGIEAEYWRLFFKELEINKTNEAKRIAVQRVASQMPPNQNRTEDLAEIIAHILEVIQ